MSEEDCILVFEASITNWCRKHSTQDVGDFSVYDFINRDQSSGVVTLHFLTTTRSTEIILTEWDAILLLTAYFKSVRPAFIHRSTDSSERLLVLKKFNEFTSCLFCE